MDALIIENLVWSEYKDEIKNVKVALVPVGSCEQHGPNTTFVTDAARADAYCKLLAKRMGNKVAAYPPVNYGQSLHHMDFVGTVTLKPETLMHVLEDIGVAIHRHGIQKILFVSGHGGNYPVCDCAVNTLNYNHQIEAYWTGIGSTMEDGGFPTPGHIKIYGHADELETSSTMALCPQFVRENRVPGQVHDTMLTRRQFRTGDGSWNWRTDASDNGALGDARMASVEIGEKITEESLNYMVELIEEIIKR